MHVTLAHWVCKWCHWEVSACRGLSWERTQHSYSDKPNVRHSYLTYVSTVHTELKCTQVCQTAFNLHSNKKGHKLQVQGSMNMEHVLSYLGKTLQQVYTCCWLPNRCTGTIISSENTIDSQHQDWYSQMSHDISSHLPLKHILFTINLNIFSFDIWY